MKKLFFAMMIVSSYFILPSCSKSSTDTVTPSISDVTATIAVTANGVNVPSAGYVFLDDSVIVTVTCTGNADNALTNLKVVSSASTFTTLNTPLTGTSAVKSSARWPAQGKGIITFTATVTGAKGNPANVTFSVNVAEIISLSPELGNQTSTTPKFFSSTVTNNTGENTFDLSDVASQPNYALDTAMDFAYCTRKTAQYMITSPDDSNATAIYGTQWSNTGERITNWPHRNKTRFILTTITKNVYEAANTKSAINALIVSAKAKGEPNLSSISVFDTQVYLFKTESGKYGLMEIKGPTGSIETVAPFGVVPGTVQLLINLFN